MYDLYEYERNLCRSVSIIISTILISTSLHDTFYFTPFDFIMVVQEGTTLNHRIKEEERKDTKQEIRKAVVGTPDLRDIQQKK